MQNTNQTTTSVANKIEIHKWDCKDLIEITTDLKGEDAIESVFHCIDEPTDEYLRDMALYNVVRFYTQVRFLVLRINQIFENSEGSKPKE